MANKYLIHGATYCGDGTTSSEAASAGAAGAWNNINVLIGTTAPAYGSLAAGDVVYVRSKTSAGADIAVTYSAVNYMGSTAATLANPITWVLDGGTVWSGVAGTMTFTGNADVQQTLPRAYNRFISEVPFNWKIKKTGTSGNYMIADSGSGNWELEGLEFDASGTTGTAGMLYFTPNCQYVVTNCRFIGPSTSSTSALFSSQGGLSLLMVNPDIRLGYTNTYGVFSSPTNGSNVKVIGGSLSGAGATTGTKLIRHTDPNVVTGQIEFIGFQFPRTVTIDAMNNDAWPGSVRAIGCDSGAGAIVSEIWGLLSSRSDGYFPYLNATLPNSTLTGWSWQVLPTNANLFFPWTLTLGKFFADTAATKTLTVEVLISDTLTGVTSKTLWATVSYVDNSTGEVRSVSTRAIVGASLTTSTAAWSATTYGAVNLLKRKLVLTTPTAIKKDTVVYIEVCGLNKATASDQMLFVCPDVAIA